MKIINVKEFFGYYLTALILSMSVHSSNAETLPLHFVSGTNVFYVGQPQTTAKLTIYEESRDSWAILEIEANEALSYQRQEDSLRAKYPNSKVSKVLSRGVDKAKVSVTSVGMSGETEWRPYQNGPGLSKSFTLTKTQTEKLVASADLGIFITGNVRAFTPEVKVIHRTVMSGEVCKTLLRNGNSVEKVIMTYPEVAKKIDTIITKLPETKMNLRKNVLKQCFDLPESTLISSFRQLLELPVRNLEPVEVVGEVRLETPTDRIGPFSTDVPKTLTSIIGG